MIKEALDQIKISFIFLMIFTLITGLIYPMFVAVVAQKLFPWQANGSLIKYNNKLIGSAIIGQPFDSQKYFWGRPSATTPFPYNAANSSGSNMGPSNPDFLVTIQNRIKHLHQADPDNRQLIPVDLVTASGSGLDADISPLSALYQVSRIAKENHLSEKEVEHIINFIMKRRTFFIFGEPRVNVLALNIALDKLRTVNGRSSIKS